MSPPHPASVHKGIKVRIKNNLSIIFTSFCTALFVTPAMAGFFSSDPINSPEDRFHANNMQKRIGEPTGVPLNTEFVIHGGDVGSLFSPYPNQAELRNNANVPVYWESRHGPKIIEFYLKLNNGKWEPLKSDGAASHLEEGMSVERFAFLFAPTEMRKYSKEYATQPPGRYRPECNHNHVGSFPGMPVSRHMNCNFEDNLVSLYTTSACIVKESRSGRGNGQKENFIYMDCGCVNTITDRSKYGYSFCTSNFNDSGRIDVEGIQKAIEQAGGLKKILKESAGIDFESADQYWPVAEKIIKAEIRAQFEADQAMKQKEIDEEAKRQDVKYQILKEKLAKATSKADIEDILSNVSLVVDWRIGRRVVPSDPDELKPKLEARLNEFVAAEKRQAELKLANWRKDLHEGDDTNCGMVIDTKKSLVKVQLRSSGKELWLKLNETLPSGEACQVEESADVSSTGSSPIDKINGILSSSIRESASFNGVGSKSWARNVHASFNACEFTLQQDIGFTFDHASGRPRSWNHQSLTMPLRGAMASAMMNGGYNRESMYGEVKLYCRGLEKCLVTEEGKRYSELAISNLQTETSANSIRDEISKLIKKCDK